MTTAAWIMLTVTWSVVLYFTVRYFFLVLQKSSKSENEEEK